MRFDQISLDRASALRKGSTDAERLLWSRVRRKRLGGATFRRQHPIGWYIVDLVCYKARLIVEIDGGQHSLQIERDTERTSYLQSRGFEVVRFWNNEVLQQIDVVVEVIREIVVERLGTPSPQSSP